MQVINKGKSDILKLLGSFPKAGIMYCKSRYVVQKETDDGLLLCNTLTGELVLLSEIEKALFNQVPIASCDLLSELIYRRYVVPAAYSEAEIVTQLRALLLNMRESKKIINQFNILPTTGCNARCFYCYENGIKHVSMSSEMANKVIDFISAHCGSTKVKLSWYGGEPTLGIKRIDQICGGLTQLGIKYESEMVSNAFLFDAALVQKAKEIWKLQTIQITLDGTEHIYNKTKAYVGINENAFQRVLRNIKLFLDQGIYVNIRLNMDDHNESDLENLIDELTEKFHGEKYLAIYVRQLDENVGFSPIQHSKKDMTRLGDRFIELQNYLEKKGWPQIWKFKLPSLVECSCMADDPSYIQITPDGIISKCEDRIYDHAIGDLKRGIVDTDEVMWWKQRISYENCNKCPLFPSCRKLLKNCPVRSPKCNDDEKRRRLERCYDTMLNEYDKWKAL